MNGIIPLFKPRGMTSFDCVSKIRRILNMKKVGHSGTLDPDVTGVLPICVGGATKVTGYLMRFGKVYQGSITLGFSTTTEDLDGNKVKEIKLSRPYAKREIDQGMRALTSERLVQVPPIYSAVRVHGKHLYEYARRGERVKRPKRVVQVHSFRQLKPARFDEATGRQIIYFRISCGKGTYVRTLATDLGRQLGVPAVMSNLVRTESGHFKLRQTVTFAQIQRALQNGSNDFCYPIDHALPGVKKYRLSSSQWQRVQNGAFLYNEEIPGKLAHVFLSYNHQIKALYQYDQRRHCYRPLRMFSIK